MRELKHFRSRYTLLSFRRTPPGVRELKPPPCLSKNLLRLRRTPPGVRELKLPDGRQAMLAGASHPSRGA